jgi:hypothetical protein
MVVVFIGWISNRIRRWKPGKRIGDPHSAVVDTEGLKEASHEDTGSPSPNASL